MYSQNQRWHYVTDSSKFYGVFKDQWPGVPKNSARDSKCPVILQVIKRRLSFSQSVRKFGIHTVRRSVYSSRTAISGALTGRNCKWTEDLYRCTVNCVDHLITDTNKYTYICYLINLKFTSTLWPWSWILTVLYTIYVKCEYFMNQEG